MTVLDRRMLIGAAAAVLIGAKRSPREVRRGRTDQSPGEAARPDDRIAITAAETMLSGGRLGITAWDTATGRSLAWRAHERFAMCSTFKLPLAAALLREVDRGRLRLDRPVRFAAADLLEHAPVVRAHLAAGVLPLATLAEAAVVTSDNSAANLLLPLVGGPAGLTRFFRTCGDAVTRLDRTEPALNTNLPGDVRDTTTPAAMAGLLRRLLAGDVLAPASRARLLGWMAACETGKARLRAGLPADWRAGDKTGTGARGAAGDVAIAWPSGRPPLLIVCYVDAPDATAAARDAAHRAVGGIAARRFG